MLYVLLFSLFSRILSAEHLASPLNRPLWESTSSERIAKFCSDAISYSPDFEESLPDEKKQACECLNIPTEGCESYFAIQFKVIDDLVESFQFSRAYAEMSQSCKKASTLQKKSNLCFMLTRACKTKGAAVALNASKSFSRQAVSDEKCWRLGGFTNEGCVSAIPCGAFANTKYLPLSVSQEKLVSSPVVLCNKNLKKSFDQKDPERKNRDFSDAIGNYLTHGHVNGPTPFGMSNCHGVTQTVHNDVLGDLPVRAVKDNYPNPERSCLVEVQERFRQMQSPRIKDISSPGGVVVNMNHENCSENDCGTAEWSIGGCSGSRNEWDSIIISDMCIKCWRKKFLNKGYVDRSNDEEKFVDSGCVLTQQDHSISVIYRNAGFCYYYETSTPWGPSRISTAPCQELWQAFPTKLCGQKMKFNLQN